MNDGVSLSANLLAGHGRLARCWRLTRRDGSVMGFTDHDRDLNFDGTTFEADAGLDAQALERSSGLSVDNTDVNGALRSDRISEADILAGRLDGAEVHQWLVDWGDVQSRELVFRGFIGEIRHGAGAFEAELRGLEDLLNRPLGRAYLRACQADLGDASCGVNLADSTYRSSGIVTDIVSDDEYELTLGDTYPDRWFQGGRLLWESSGNVGQSSVITSDRGEQEKRRMRFLVNPSISIQVGDTFTVTAGCDKQLGTCREKFFNLLNFRGFPFMPGEDWVVSYPVSGAEHDGSAVFWNEVSGE